MVPRFLSPSEYGRTKALAVSCFGSGDWLEDYYRDGIFAGRVVVLEDGDAVISMAHLRLMLLHYADRTVPAWYLSYVCTAENRRREGCMDAVLSFALAHTDGPAFLVPVEQEIYAHLGFDFCWPFREEDRALLDADEGLQLCMARGLTEAPLRISAPMTVQDLQPLAVDGENLAVAFDYFSLRPNLAADSVPLETLFYRNVGHTKFCFVDDRCVLVFDEDNGAPTGRLPFCRQAELPHYFTLLQRYCNEILHTPLRIIGADAATVAYLQACGRLEHYTATENEQYFDYVYDAEALRTLTGKKYAKKRNLIRQFERNYEGRWEYRTLGCEDRETIVEYLRRWDDQKVLADQAVSYFHQDLDARKTLDIDVAGTLEALRHPALLEKLHIGGIFIDGTLSAFSIGGCNPTDRMAVIIVEKADAEINGLYQIINREFLRHEFPEAELVNREDDAGLPGLQKAKMSYYPTVLVKKNSLQQTDFTKKES